MLRSAIRDNTAFKHNIKSSDSVVNDLSEHIWNELSGIDKTKLVNKKKKFLTTVILNCAMIANISDKRIRYSRNKNSYKVPARYRIVNNTYSTFISIIDALENSQYICNDIETKALGNSLQSTFYPTYKLLKHLEKIDSSMYFFTPYLEPIILRDENGISIDYRDTSEIIDARKELKAYNDIRSKFTLSLKNIPVEITNSNETAKILNRFTYEGKNKNELIIKPTYAHRVYNESFERGGRYYGTIETQIPRELRPLILIDGHDTVEVDYSSYHIRMLYHLKEIDYKEDAYGALAKGDPVLRKVFKQIGLISINANSFNAAVQGYLYEVKKEKFLEGFTDLSHDIVKKYTTEWMNFHSDIEEHFFSDAGARLQNQDSKIASKVIKHFVEKNEMILCIHDSFIVKKSLEAELRSVMLKCYDEEIGFQPILD